MSRQYKTLTSTAKTWQRHALAQACFMVAAGISTAAWAQAVYTPGAAMSSTNATLGLGTAVDATQSAGDYWSTGYNAQIRNYQLGTGNITGVVNGSNLSSTLTGTGSTPVSLNANSLLMYAYGNQNSNANLALNTLTAASSTDDGQLALNLQILSGIATDAAPDTFGKLTVLAFPGTSPSMTISQTGKSSAALSLSSNTMGANLALNTVSTSVTGATPSAYVSTTQGTSSVAYGDNNSTGSINATAPNSTRGTTGSVNLSNLQSTFNAEGQTQLDTPTLSVTVRETYGTVASPANLSSGISVNANSLTTSSTSNEASSVFLATSGSSAFTGSVSVTNIQATKSSLSTSQLADVSDSVILADLVGKVDRTAETTVSGTVTVNANTVSAKSQGNTAGARTSTGSISVGNAIIFESSSNITGSTAATVHSSAITTTTTEGKADLLINSVQRNAGNVFTSSVDNSGINTKADNLAAGSLAQNSNTQSATATANLAGSLINAGTSASVGNIQANAAVLNTQANSSVSSLASVTDSTQQVTVGIAGSANTITGSVSLNDNSILATAEGNAAASQLSLKASTLTVSGSASGTGLVDLKPAAAAVASSGLAASVLSVQANDSLTLTSNNNGNTVSAQFNDQAVAPANLAITGSQVSVNNNTIASTAIANAASNANNLVATNAPGLNAGLGNSQRNTGSTVIANAGDGTAVGVAIVAESVTGSSLSLNTNSVDATAKGNSSSNSLTVEATTATGLSAATLGFGVLKPYSQAADVGNSTAGVQANADFAFANAQYNTGGSLFSVVSGSTKITTAIVDSSTLSANGNSLTGSTSVNSAGNALSLSITNMTGMTAGLSSAQSVGGVNNVSSTTTGTVSIDTAGAAINNGSSLNLNSNTTSSAVYANTVVNALNLTATTASGRDLSVGPTTNSGSATSQNSVANVTADFALANQQQNNHTIFTATTAAATTVTAGAGAISASSVTVNANRSLAIASANQATNSIALAVNNLSQPNTGLASSQITNSSMFEATVDDGALALGGTGYVGTGAATNAQIAVTNNLLMAEILGNKVTNTLTLSGSQATGSTLPMADNTTTTNGASGAITTYASAGLANWQTITGAKFTANVGGLASAPLIFLTAGNVDNSGTTRSTLNLSSNTLATSVKANDASNTLALSATQASNMTTALASGQSLTASNSDTAYVTASTLGQVVLTAGTVEGLTAASNTLTANSNVISSTLRVNNVSNTQQLRGDQFTGQTTLVPAFSASANSVVTAKSDLSLANVQVIVGAGKGATASTTGDVSVSLTSLEFANVSNNSNALSAYASGNSASNLSDVQVTGLNAASLGVMSSQSVSNYPVSATTTGDVKITGADALANPDAGVTLNANTLSATAIRNTADNTLTVQATNASGRAVASRQSLASSGLTIAADYALGNFQYGGTGSTAATTTSNVALSLGTSSATRSELTVESNSLSAYASGNTASNQMTLAMNQLTQASAAVSSYQSGDAASITGDFDGRVKLTVGTVDTAALSMKDNSIKASAIGNVAGNKLDVTANTATSTGTGDVAAGATGSTATVNADFAVTNVQSSTVGATPATNITATTKGSINVETTSVTSSSLGLTGNSIASLAVGNSAGNTLLLKVAQQSGLAASSAGLTAAVSSSQSNDVLVSASTEFKDSNLFGIQATTGVTTSTLTLSDNTASAVASKNEAFNTLTVSGANVFGRGGDVTGSVAGTSSVTGADFAVINAQSASGATTASMSSGAMGLSTGASGVGGAGTLTVSGNTVSASASANTTGNNLSLAASNLLEASAVINNVQSLAASASVTSSVLTGSLGVETSGDAGKATVAVINNLVKSSASANVATNALNATSSTGTLNAGAVTSPVGTTGTPTFAVLNSQSTYAGSSVTSSVTNFTIGGQQLSGALNSGGSASVTGNAIQSLAYGNSASNAIQVSALTAGLNTASASITNVQYNMAAVSASVTGSSMQANGLNSTGAASVNMAGNSIVAMAVGNRAVNTITGR